MNQKEDPNPPDSLFNLQPGEEAQPTHYRDDQATLDSPWTVTPEMVDTATKIIAKLKARKHQAWT